MTLLSPTRTRANPDADPRPATAARRPVRVVHLLHTVAHGGVETLVLNWIKALDPARIEVKLICFANADGSERPFREAAARAGLAVETIPWSRGKPVFRAARRLTELLRAFQADIVHTHNVYAELVGWIAARRAGAKVMTTQYVWADFGWKRNLQQWFAARLLRRFDLVTSQCETTMRDTIRRGVPEAGQCVLVTGIEPLRLSVAGEPRDAIRAQLGAGPQDVVFANVARFYPEKAHAFLLESFADLIKQRPQARLWLLGVGPLEAELKATVAALGLGGAVTFLGFVVDLPRTLLAADVQIHPSHAEGVPLAIGAGMAAGMPILATAVGGVPEVIRHEATGLLVERGDRAALVREAVRLIDDAPLRRTLGAAAKTAAESEFSLETAAAVLSEKYEELARP